MSLTSRGPNQWQLFANKEYKVNKDRFGSSDTLVQPKRSPTTHPPQPPPPPLNNELSLDSQPHRHAQALQSPVTSWQNFAKQHLDLPQRLITEHVVSSPSKSPEPGFTPLQEISSFKVQNCEHETQQQKTYPRPVGHIHSLPDPPLCFCEKTAAGRVVPGIGTIYECFNTDLNCATTGTSRRVVCTFHIHKQAWDRARQSLKDGRCVDYNDSQLIDCPAFNYTFRVILRTDNKFPVQPLAYPNCFCNLPAACHQISQRCDNRFVFICSLYEHDATKSRYCCWLMWAEKVKVVQPPLLHQQSISLDSRRVTDTIPLKIHLRPRPFESHPSRPSVLPANYPPNQKDEDTEREYDHRASYNSSRPVGSSPALPEHNMLIMRRDRFDSSDLKEDEHIYSRRQFPSQPALFSKFVSGERNPKSNDFIRLFSDAKCMNWFEQAKDTSFASDNTDTLSSDSDHSSKSPHSGAVSPTATSTFAFKLSIPTTVMTRRAVDNMVDVDQLLRELEEEERRMAEEEIRLKEIAEKFDIAKSRLQELVEEHGEEENEESGERVLVSLENEKNDILRRIEGINIRWKQDTMDLERSEQYKAIYSRANNKAAEYIQDLEEKILSTEELKESMSMRHFKCRVCFQENIQAALVPCFHCSYCYKCAHKLTECAICRVIKFEVQPIALD